MGAPRKGVIAIPCLKCNKKFKPLSKFNRLCFRCIEVNDKYRVIPQTVKTKDK
jgi:DNA polymerase II large subunit